MGASSAAFHFSISPFSLLQILGVAAIGYAAGYFQSKKRAHSSRSQCYASDVSLFEQAIEHSASGLIICDAQQPDLPIIYASPSFEDLTGYTPQEVRGKNCRFMQQDDKQQLGLTDIREAIAQGTGCKVLLRNYHKSGRAFWNELTLSPLKDNSGTVTHYVGTQVDISHYLDTFKALQESELRYQHLYEETPAMLHSIDSDGRITIVSHDWLEKLGYERHEVIGQPISTFLTKASSGKVAKVQSQMQPHEIYRNLPCRLIKKNGKRIDALLSTVLEDDSSLDKAFLGRNTVSSLGVLVDITERKRAKEKLRRSEALLRAINDLPPTGIFVMDCNSSEVLFINSEFYRIWQVAHLQSAVAEGRLNGEALLSECLQNVDLSAFVTASTAEDFTDGNKVVEDEVPLLDGRTLRRIYGPIQEDDTTFAYLYVFEDITERKQAVQKLAEATQAAEAANRAKSEFLANMSHELRSPLNAILGFAHILKENNPRPEQKENLEIIYRSGEHLLALINDVLDISKIEAGRAVLNEEAFDLYNLLDELQQMFQETVREKGLALNIVRGSSESEVGSRVPHLPRMIFSDRLKLRQILINLLSNAVKFTTRGSITLTAKCEPLTTQDDAEQNTPVSSQNGSKEAARNRSKQSFTFAVTDTGPGVSPPDQARLFDAFVQTESGLTARQGTGLGLAISSEYAHLLGGYLSVESDTGKGATFSLTMTARPLEAQAVALNAQADDRKIVGLAPGQPAYRILVADDSALNRKLLHQLLTNVGFEVQLAINGQEAIAQWQSWQPHLIWMDMRMPVLNGAEATQQIKALDTQQRTAILALTASVFEDNRAEAIDSGCDDFVNKPIQAREIFEKMAQYIGVRYQYASDAEETAVPEVSESLTSDLLAIASDTWRDALVQATLDLDDETILQLANDLPDSQRSLANAVQKCVADMSYKKLLQALQEAEAVML